MQNQSLVLSLSLSIIFLVSLTFVTFAIPIPNKIMGQSSTSTNESYYFVKKWGINGQGNKQFIIPEGIAIDSSNNLYIADSGNDRIQKFDSNGNFITKWGTNGKDNGMFFYPKSVDVDSSGNVYVDDNGNTRIQKFDSNGNFITKWGSEGTGDGQMDNAYGITVDSSGNVYIADYGNDRIQKFDSNGTFIAKWGSKGTADGQLKIPNDVAVDSSGNVYVTDTGNNRIQVFAPITQNQYSEINENHGKNLTSLIPTQSIPDANIMSLTPNTETTSKNTTHMLANLTASIIPMNKTSGISDNTTIPNTKNNTSTLPQPHAGISDQF